LAVDDNEALRYSVVRSLREAGYQVKEARTGQEALALAAEIPDLILLDVNLPDMHGFEICKRIKSNPTTAHIPVLHVSATFVDPEARIEGLSSGADAYLVEPIDRGELVATVGALLRLKNAEILARQQAMIADNARQELAQLNATLEKRVTERTAELKQANDSLKELSARILEMQDEERKRIARELHDSVGQLLAAITMNNAFIFSEASKLTAPSVKALNENETIVQEILRGIRTMSHLLHPPLLDEAGLRSALQWYVDEFGDRSGISVVLECDPSVGRLPGNLETAIFRIVQECLGNVHRHSGSATAVIRLKIDGDRVNLEVSDQGNGISPEKREEMKSGFRAGVGLRSMHERVAQFQGELQIHSGSGGTTVTAMFPNQPTVYAETV
jgi:signal transduction histidine kinase